MSEDAPTPPVKDQTPEGPQLQLLTQYVKDLSFENPHAPGSLQSGPVPAIDFEIGVQVQPANDEVYEVSLNISINATREDTTVFLLEFVYAGLFAVKGFPEDSLSPVLHIECTRLIFPYARRIVSDLTQDGGFPALPLDMIDFASIYRANLEHQATQQTNGTDAASPAEESKS